MEKLDNRCAKQAQEGGWRVTETLHWNPMGTKFHPVTVSHRPEASLA